MYNLSKKIIICFLFFVCITPVFASEWNLPGINIISRSQWGADESIRLSTMSHAERRALQRAKTEEELRNLEQTDFERYLERQKTIYENTMRNEYLLLNFSQEQKIDRIVYQLGRLFLKWPQSYHYQKNKIIVHHTAGDTSGFTGQQSAINNLRDIYRFHTLNRGWGDIGYNFVIDPYGNIYEGRAGGDSVIGAHTNRNNTPSIGISLMGNFEIQQPTVEQLNSLINLIAVLSKKYNIDPMAQADYHKVSDNIPYMVSNKVSVIAGHKDAGVTACPGRNLYSLLPQIRNMVLQTLARGILVKYQEPIKVSTNTNQVRKTSSSSQKRGLDLLKDWQPRFDVISELFKKEYIKKHKTSLATNFSQKITTKIYLDEIRQLVNSDISVLLYELSKDFNSWDISCTTTCYFKTPSGTHQSKQAKIEVSEGGLVLTVNNKKYIESNIDVITTANEKIEIVNYPRVSFLKIPRNIFYGTLSFERGQIRNLKTGRFDNQYIIINTLSFHNYLKGIVETNDSEHPEKIKTINLISKGYALFYKNGKNKHPSIPDGAKYTAVDSPDIFQKYVGAGLENTLSIVPKLVDEQKNQILLYEGYNPILPYFNCSAGFTRSAKDKRGWTDTPYLVSRVDIDKCSDFNGHGVGLSGRGAQFFATNGWNYIEILNYYYPGVQIINL